MTEFSEIKTNHIPQFDMIEIRISRSNIVEPTKLKWREVPVSEVYCLSKETTDSAE